jgi:hypothetical protein
MGVKAFGIDATTNDATMSNILFTKSMAFGGV